LWVAFEFILYFKWQMKHGMFGIND
jgi:hypothetical protein